MDAIQILVNVMLAYPIRSIVSMRISKVLATVPEQAIQVFVTARPFTVMVAWQKLVSVMPAYPIRTIVSVRISKVPATVPEQAIQVFVTARPFTELLAIPKPEGASKTSVMSILI